MSTPRSDSISPPMPGMRAFTIVVIGQAVSFIGTGMARFALMFWVFEETGKATELALLGFFSFAPLVLVSPLAGALVDRWNRKLVMMLSDLAAGLSTIAILLLFMFGRLEIWHLYAAGAFAGIFEAFQWPAFSASITTMVPKEQYGRANGMLSLAQSLSGILAPVFAGGLLKLIGIDGILSLDIVTFAFAIVTLALVTVPQPKASAQGKAGSGSLLEESVFGFRYIWVRRPLLALQLVFTGVNLTATLGWTLITPMILASTGSDAATLATVMAVTGAGGVLGGLLMSTWGGPGRRIHGVLGGMIVGGLFGQALMGLGSSVVVWSAAAFISSAAIVLLNTSNQSIWQAKVEPDVQGRVFAVRRLIAQSTGPIGMLLAGPLADKLFEPAMNVGGKLEPLLGEAFGTGPGAGMSVIFTLTGVLTACIGLAGYAVPIIRNVEDILPDYDEPAAEPGREGGEDESAFAQGAAAMAGRASGSQEAGAQPADRQLPHDGDGRIGSAALAATGLVAAIAAVALTLGVVSYLNDGSLRFQQGGENLQDGGAAVTSTATSTVTRHDSDDSSATATPGADSGAARPSQDRTTGSAEAATSTPISSDPDGDRPLSTATLRIARPRPTP